MNFAAPGKQQIADWERGRGVESVVELLEILSDGGKRRSETQAALGRIGHELSVPVVVLCEYEPEVRAMQTTHVVKGVAGDFPVTDSGLMFGYRTPRLEPWLWQTVTAGRPMVLRRDFMEHWVYPDSEMLDWYASYDYRGWLELPLTSGGLVRGKVSLMTKREDAVSLLDGVLGGAAFRDFISFWRLDREVAKLRRMFGERERQRLAEELQGSLMQSLTAISREAKAVDHSDEIDGRAIEHLQRIGRSVAEGLTEMRRVVGGLAPGGTDRVAGSRSMRKLSAENVRVLLVDDEEMVLEGLARILATEPGVHVIGRVARAADVLDSFRTRSPDVVVVDGTMPEIGGVELTHRLIALDPSARILILSSIGTEELIRQCTEAGARGFILKGSGSGELVSAIQALAVGKTFFGEGISNKLGANLKLPQLTRREMEILPMVAAGWSNKELAGRLGVSSETVKDRLRTLFRKLGVNSRLGLVARVREMGLLGD